METHIINALANFRKYWTILNTAGTTDYTESQPKDCFGFLKIFYISFAVRNAKYLWLFSCICRESTALLILIVLIQKKA